jgi:hypothetical protein
LAADLGSGLGDRTVADDVLSLMAFARCMPGREHRVVPTSVASYWLCPHCGLQVHWPVEGEAVEHRSPGEKALERWAKSK